MELDSLLKVKAILTSFYELYEEIKKTYHDDTLNYDYLLNSPLFENTRFVQGLVKKYNKSLKITENANRFNGEEKSVLDAVPLIQGKFFSLLCFLELFSRCT